MHVHRPRSVFYHHPCIDGSTAAWAVHKALGEQARYIGLDHAEQDDITDKILHNVTAETVAVFVDFAPAPHVLNDILDHVQGIEIYDHHVSAMRALTEFQDHPKVKMTFDLDRSGAGLAYDIFSLHSGRPLFIDLVERVDLARGEQFDSPDQFFLVSSFINTMDVTRPLDHVFADIDELCQINDIHEFERRGAPARRQYQRQIRRTLEAVDYMNLSMLKYGRGLTNIPAVHGHIGNLGHEFIPRLLALCPHQFRMGVIWSYQTDDMITMSLRSDKEIDVSMIAVELADAFGLSGGGHHNIAAVRFTVDQFHDFAMKAGLYFDKKAPRI